MRLGREIYNFRFAERVLANGSQFTVGFFSSVITLKPAMESGLRQVLFYPAEVSLARQDSISQ